MRLCSICVCACFITASRDASLLPAAHCCLCVGVTALHFLPRSGQITCRLNWPIERGKMDPTHTPTPLNRSRLWERPSLSRMFILDQTLSLKAERAQQNSCWNGATWLLEIYCFPLSLSSYERMRRVRSFTIIVQWKIMEVYSLAALWFGSNKNRKYGNIKIKRYSSYTQYNKIRYKQ